MKKIYTLLLLLAIAFSIQAQDKDYKALEDAYMQYCLSDSTLVGYQFITEKVNDTSFRQIMAFNPASMFQLMQIGAVGILYVDQRVEFSQAAYWSYLKQNTESKLPEFPLNAVEIKLPQTPTFEGFYQWRSDKQWPLQQKKDVKQLKEIK